jgi:hypothetical protein
VTIKYIYRIKYNLFVAFHKNQCELGLEFSTYAQELDGPAVSALRRAITEVKQHWLVIRWVTKKKKNNYVDLLRASESTLSR